MHWLWLLNLLDKRIGPLVFKLIFVNIIFYHHLRRTVLLEVLKYRGKQLIRDLIYLQLKVSLVALPNTSAWAALQVLQIIWFLHFDFVNDLGLSFFYFSRTLWVWRRRLKRRLLLDGFSLRCPFLEKNLPIHALGTFQDFFVFEIAESIGWSLSW